jgi:hypothetical protein
MTASTSILRSADHLIWGKSAHRSQSPRSLLRVQPMGDCLLRGAHGCCAQKLAASCIPSLVLEPAGAPL